MCRKMIFIQPRCSPALVSFFLLFFDAVKVSSPAAAPSMCPGLSHLTLDTFPALGRQGVAEG